jgi:hypothetical protein
MRQLSSRSERKSFHAPTPIHARKSERVGAIVLYRRLGDSPLLLGPCWPGPYCRYHWFCMHHVLVPLAVILHCSYVVKPQLVEPP